MTEETLFQEALARSAEERAMFLAQACAGRPGLLAAVEALLAAHEKPSNLLDRPPAQLGQTDDSDPGQGCSLATGEYPPEGENPPLRLATTTHHGPRMEAGVVIAGRYVLQQKIGEGGMGEVWVAKQTEPVKRKVALKLIKTGMDSKAVLTRFEQERQALAMMDHPNIARVLDGGLTPAGQPFFVMELVNGLALTRFCDEARLTTKERLELFVPICQAVQHAHQKGIVHRDLKPANILVTLIDGKPIPKVIDFGVAKATAGKLTDEALSTQFGAVVGTFEYMAPEQAGFTGSDIDTRADLYSLGVILYELLTGLRPLDAKRLRRVALAEMVRILQEEEPSRPSTRLSTDESLPSLAALRQTEPGKLMALLRGELDWVVMKCLEKQRDRRYETASGLARDLQRYLADEPVEARPPSAGYRLGKFLKRNKGPVAAAALVLFALLAGMAGTTWGLIEARRQEGLAEEGRRTAEAAQTAAGKRAEGERLAKIDAQQQEQRANERAEGEKKARQAETEQRAIAKAQQVKAEQAAIAEKAANAQAQKRLQQIEKANALLGSIFEDLDPKEIARAERPLQAILVEKLELAVAQLEGESVGDPLVVAALQEKFGNSLLGLGEPAKAIVLLKKALATRQAKLGLDNPETFTTMNYLANAYRAAGKLVLALTLYEQTLKFRKAKLGPKHPDTLGSMNNLALAYQDVGKQDLALPLLEQSLKLMKATVGPAHPGTLLSMNNLASAYHVAGKLDLALPLLEQTLQFMKAKHGPEHPDTLVGMSNLALAYQEAGKLDLALPLLEQTLQFRKVRLGPDHPQTLGSMYHLAGAYRADGKGDLALALYKQTLKLMKAKLGSDHPKTLYTLNGLASTYWSMKQLDKSIPLYEETLKRWEAKLGRDHPDTLTTVANLGVNYRDAGRLQEALPLLEEAQRAAQKYPRLHWVGPALLAAYAQAGENAKFANLVQQQLAEVRQMLPRDSPQRVGLLAQIARLLLQQKKWTEAEPLLRECLVIRAKQAPDDWKTFNTQSQLGGALLGQQKYADAEPLLLAGYEGMKKREIKILPQDRPRLTEAVERLVQLYEATDSKDEAAKWRKQREAITTVKKQLEKQP